MLGVSCELWGVRCELCDHGVWAVSWVSWRFEEVAWFQSIARQEIQSPYRLLGAPASLYLFPIPSFSSILTSSSLLSAALPMPEFTFITELYPFSFLYSPFPPSWEMGPQLSSGSRHLPTPNHPLPWPQWCFWGQVFGFPSLCPHGLLVADVSLMCYPESQLKSRWRISWESSSWKDLSEIGMKKFSKLRGEIKYECQKRELWLTR